MDDPSDVEDGVDSERMEAALALAEDSPYFELAQCLFRHEIVLYRSDSGTYRIYGDINAMQDAVDDGCGPLLTQEINLDLVSMFREIDGLIAECLGERGIEANYDPEQGIQVDDGADPNTVEECVNATYARFKHPPQ